MTPSLPLQPADATPIASCFSWAIIDDTAWYFSNLEPFDCHAADDTRARALRIARFSKVSRVRCADLVRAFAVSRPTVYRAVKLLETSGEAAFGAPRRPRGRTVITPAMACRGDAGLGHEWAGLCPGAWCVEQHLHRERAGRCHHGPGDRGRGGKRAFGTLEGGKGAGDGTGLS